MNRTGIIVAGVAAVGIVGGGVAYWLTRPTSVPAPDSAQELGLPSAPGNAPAPAPAPQAVQALIAPAFDVVRVEPDGSAVIAGRAAPGDTVTVMDGDRAVGQVTADARGEWVLIPDTALQPGARELTVVATGTDGSSRKGEEVVTLVVPESARDIAGQPQTGTGAALAVLTPADGGSRVLQAPREAGEVPEIRLDAVDYDRDGRIAVGGSARPGAQVQVYLDNTLLGRAPADEAGRWTLSPDRAVEPGQYALRADQIREDGRVAARAEVAFRLDPFPTDALSGKAVVVLPGNNLWAIARRTFGEGLLYTAIFQQNQGQIRDPNLIYPGQIFILPQERSQ